MPAGSQVDKSKSFKDLLQAPGARLGALQERVRKRGAVLALVRATLPAELSAAVISAGLEMGVLSVGIAGAAWAARLRYATELLRLRIGSSLGIEVQRVRIRVVPPRP